MDIKNRFKVVLMGVFLALYSVTPVYAGSTVQPNVVFIVDTSGSMGTGIEVAVDYDYTTTYAGIGCYDTNAIYYNTSGTPPLCGDTDYFDKAANKCDASVREYSGGVVIDPIGPLLKWGVYSDQMAQFATTGSNGAWRAIQSENAADRALPVECITDSGVHGEADGSKPYIEDNNTGGWTNTAPADPLQPHPIWFGAANNLQLFDGNYLNYRDSVVGTTLMSRMEVVKEAVSAIVSSNQNVNIGLMRFDGQWDFEGGAVLFPALDAKANRNDFNASLANNVFAGGSTPLSETLYEAMLYFGGKPIEFGNDAQPPNHPATKENGNPNNYETPITDECQKNYIVLLSDGAPQLDYLDSTQRAALPGFDVNSCNTDADPGLGDLLLSSYNKDAYTSATSTRDNCLDELAAWALNNDVAERDSTYSSHEGDQNITTYTIGFDFATGNSDLQAAEQLLRDTASAGGGSFFEAVSKQSLLNAFNEILAEVLAAEVSVNTAPTDLFISNNMIDELASPDDTTTAPVTVGVLSTTDSDSCDTHTYSITGGDDAASFQLNGNALEVATGVLLDFETKPGFLVEVTSTDYFGQSTNQSFTITLNDVTEAPPDTDGDGLTDDFEISAGLDPTKPDTDDDGVNDFDEANFDGDPSTYNPFDPTGNPTGTDLNGNSGDSDGDGIGDAEELGAGSDPLDVSSIPGVASGDANGDGVVNAADVLLVTQVVLGKRTPDANELLRSDVAPTGSPDGVINVGDLIIIQNQALQN